MTSFYLVVLGGKARSSNIEQHDVRWVVGDQIEDAYSELRNQWHGIQTGLHIDSYSEIKHVDGYKIALEKRNVNKSLTNKYNYRSDSREATNSLWFVNLGAYDPSSLSEVHKFGLIVARTKEECLSRAKKKWLLGYSHVHLDNYYNILSIPIPTTIKNYKNQQEEWIILLTKDKNSKDYKLSPDWFGYKPIQGSIQKGIF